MPKTIHLPGGRRVTIATGNGLWIPCGPPRQPVVPPIEHVHAIVDDAFGAGCVITVATDESGAIIAIEGTAPLRLKMAIPGWTERIERALRAAFPGDWSFGRGRGIYEFRYQTPPLVTGGIT